MKHIKKFNEGFFSKSKPARDHFFDEVGKKIDGEFIKQSKKIEKTTWTITKGNWSITVENTDPLGVSIDSGPPSGVVTVWYDDKGFKGTNYRQPAVASNLKVKDIYQFLTKFDFNSSKEDFQRKYLH